MNLVFELGRAERIREDLEKLIVIERYAITDYVMKSGEYEGIAYENLMGWQPYTMGDIWSDLDDHRWFKTTVIIPESMEGKHVEFRITTGREGQWDATNPQMLFYINGEIVQGIDVNHREVTLSPEAIAGEKYEIAILAYSGSVEGDLIIKTDLIAIDDCIQNLYYDLLIPLQSAFILKNGDEENYRRILQKLAPVIECLDMRKPYSDKFYESITQASEMLREAFYSSINEAAPRVSAIGHTHIDIAWLWTVAQTREKVLRSFATVLRLMEQYPDYKFMSSQPILYQFVKEQAPEMYAKIKERVKEGRWEVDGAMWLEADCNLTGGESLVRQILKGHRFIWDEFGVESKSLWLPDVFGYSAAIPQILKKSRIPYFMTTKIAWNQYNQLPNDTFIWKGIDGSEVFAFMPTTTDFDKSQGLNISFSDTRNTTTYTGIVNPNMTLGTFKRFQNRDLTEDTLMLFGFGDGGGGPTKEMLESAERLKYGLPGIPRIHQEFEQDYFDRTYEKIAEMTDMPKWEGELYFEYHRGTLTSIAKNKKNNRKNEHLYMQIETLSCMADVERDEELKKVVNRGWDVLLLNQFHDIIPGTSIEAVYHQTDKEYAEIYENGMAAVTGLLDKITSEIPMEKDGLIVVNTLSYQRNDFVQFKAAKNRKLSLIDGSGNVSQAQEIEEGTYIFMAKDVPAFGYKQYYYLETQSTEIIQTEVNMTEWNGRYENEFYKVEFNEQMQITSLIEKSTRKEFIRDGQLGNELVAYEDRPMQWDNWDIDVFYQKKSYGPDNCSAARVVENGDVRLVLEYDCQFMDSVVTQQVCLYHNSPRIDFKTKANWHEHNVLLRVNFPVNVNTNKASFEIQYGNVERETTNNTSWDSAKFETCGHKWADLSENNSGISLLNDCKYGYGVKQGNLSLTLIKAGTYPNPNADICEHEFVYSIYPHAGRWQEAETVEMAYNLNVPLLAHEKLASGTVVKQETTEIKGVSYLTVDADSCLVEVIKNAEDGNGVIARIYEYKNNQLYTMVHTNHTLKTVYECNLLEENERELELKEGKDAFETQFKPYEIKTLRLIYE